MALFSPYDVEREYGKPFADISVTEHYDEMVANPRIHKKYIDAREFFMTIAEIQFESGYPYILFEDTVNRTNPIEGRITMSNLCSEILQTQEASTYNADLSYSHVGRDISCNLGSLNIAKTMDGDLGTSVDLAVRALTSVSEHTSIDSVPSIRRGNAEGHAIGLGQMNLHGFLAREHMQYGSEEALDFTDMYFMTVAYHAYKASHALAVERGHAFANFKTSAYAKPAGKGNYFDKYTDGSRSLEPKLKKFAICLPVLTLRFQPSAIGSSCATRFCATAFITSICKLFLQLAQSRTSTIPQVQSTRLLLALRFAKKARLDASTTLLHT